MRIIGGIQRGRKLRVPRGQLVRPTSDRVKEALFNILGARVIRARVLDLFSGTGSLCLEALSRGAEAAVCVECNRRVLGVLHANVRDSGFEDQVDIFSCPVKQALKALGREGQKFSLIFMDPPYHQELVLPTARLIAANQLLGPGGLVIAEHAADELREPPPGMTLVVQEQRRYGTTALTFLACPEAGEPK